jgi:endonuclease YncB( thermonuclease family)
VVGVADGDTITVLDDRLQQHKVRLAGIDAPEKAQDFGQRSRQSLAVLTFARRVSVQAAKKDRYGRWVGKVTVSGSDASLRQIEAGLAWHYRAYQREQERDDRLAYAAAENVARGSKTGLWAMPRPVPPWEFRARKRRSWAASATGARSRT